MKCAAAALVLCFLLPAGANAQKKKKDKKDKEPFQWVMPALSGDKDVDQYLLDCDDCWNRTLAYTQNLTMYHIDTTYVKGVMNMYNASIKKGVTINTDLAVTLASTTDYTGFAY